MPDRTARRPRRSATRAALLSALLLAFAALTSAAQAGTSTDDVKAGSGTNAPGDPPAWHGALAFIGWILVALGVCAFLFWILFGRALLRSSDDDADAAEPAPPDAAPQ
jgi:hypothetical protein